MIAELLAIMALVSSGTAVLAQDVAQPTPAVAKEKKICRSVVPTGSIMAKRYCLTKAEWARINELNDNGSADYFRNKRSIGCGKATMDGGPAMCGGGE